MTSENVPHGEGRFSCCASSQDPRTPGHRRQTPPAAEARENCGGPHASPTLGPSSQAVAAALWTQSGDPDVAEHPGWPARRTTEAVAASVGHDTRARAQRTAPRQSPIQLQEAPKQRVPIPGSSCIAQTSGERGMQSTEKPKVKQRVRWSARRETMPLYHLSLQHRRSWDLHNLLHHHREQRERHAAARHPLPPRCGRRRQDATTQVLR